MNVRSLHSNAKKELTFLNGQKVKNYLLFVSKKHKVLSMRKNYWKMNGETSVFFVIFYNRSAWVSIMLKKGLDFKIHNSHINKNGRYIILEINIHDQRLTLANVYG